MIIDNYDGFIFDLDGTIYLGDNLIKGAKKVIKAIKDKNKNYVFLTNKPLSTRENYAKKLNNLGIKASRENIITSSYVTAEYLKNKKPINCYVIGEKALKKELVKVGVNVSTKTENIDYLIASFDRKFNYKKLNDALQIIKNGAKFIATNPDKTCPTENGEIPDAAGMIGAIEGTTGKKVEKILGKPSDEIVNIALQSMNIENKNTLMIGDRIETDILMGNNNGLSTALVLSGVTNEKLARTSDVKPDYILNTVAELI